jgi:hypothetical protein
MGALELMVGSYSCEDAGSGHVGGGRGESNVCCTADMISEAVSSYFREGEALFSNGWLWYTRILSSLIYISKYEEVNTS